MKAACTASDLQGGGRKEGRERKQSSASAVPGPYTVMTPLSALRVTRIGRPDPAHYTRPPEVTCLYLMWYKVRLPAWPLRTRP